MPDALASLQALGVAIPLGLGRAFRGIRYCDGDLVAEGLFPQGETGLGLRRPQLVAALAERTEAVGARIYWGVGATALHPVGLAAAGGRLRASWVVAADGLHSRVRRLAGLARPPGPRMRFGIRRHYRVRPWTDLVEVYWADRAEAYVTPVGEEEVGIALLWSVGKERFDTLLARFPALARRVEGSPRSSEDRGAGPFDQRVRAVVRGNLALLGDAAGYLDAVTG